MQVYVGWRTVLTYANAGGQWLIQRQRLLVQQKQQADTILSMYKYTLLVICGNDKNRIYRKKNVNDFLNSEENLKNLKKTRRDTYFRPRCIHFCQQKPNPARETVPSSLCFRKEHVWLDGPLLPLDAPRRGAGLRSAVPPRCSGARAAACSTQPAQSDPR
jgi:hypothetical protein